MLDDSLKSATAAATLGSFLSMLIVLLTLLITSVVSLAYSSSSLANAGVVGRRNAGKESIPAANDKKLRRCRGTTAADVLAALLVVVVGLVSFDLIGDSSFGVEVVGVIKVGEAIFLVFLWGVLGLKGKEYVIVCGN